MINSNLEIFLSAESASKKKTKLIKTKTKATNILTEEADQIQKRNISNQDEDDLFEYNLKKFKLNK
jgi:hypothetical protein